MADAKHSNQSPSNGGIHVIHAYEYANSSERMSAEFVSADIGKVVRQLDDDTFYIVTGSGSGSSVFENISGGSGGGGSVNVSDDDPVNVNVAAADAGLDGYASRSDHKHSIDTATAVSIGASNAEGASISLARADHTHAVTDLVITNQEQGSILYFNGTNWVQLGPSTDGYVLTTHNNGEDPTWDAPVGGGGGSDLATSPPEDVDTDSAETGVSIRAARADHKHDVSTDTAVSVGNTNAEGSSLSLARADHTHAIADLVITSQEQGSILYFDGTNWVQLTPGDDGYVLTTGGSGQDPAWEEVVGGGGGGATDHGDLTGLSDDDHAQYLLVNGTRSMSGNLNMGTNNITNVGTVDGVTISAHAARHITGGDDEIDGDQIDIDFTPSNYTPSTAPAEVTNVDHLTAHLSGIDTALGVGGGGGISGPGSSVENSIAIFDDTDGQSIDNTTITIVDGYYVEGVESLLFNDTLVDPPTTSNGEIWFNERLNININGTKATVVAHHNDSGIIDNTRANVVTEWQEACSITTDNSGIFDLHISFIWSGSNTTDRCQVRLLKNGTPVGAYGVDRDGDGMILDAIPTVASGANPASVVIPAYTTSNDEYSLEYRNAAGAVYCTVGVPRISPIRVSDLDPADNLSGLIGRFHADRGNYAWVDDTAPVDWWQDYLTTAIFIDGINGGGEFTPGGWSDGSDTIQMPNTSGGFQGNCSSASNNYTICYLFNPSIATGEFRNLLRSTSSGFEIGCFQSHTGDDLHYEYGNGGTPQSLGVAATTGEQFLVFVFDFDGAGDVRVYRDGTLLATDDISGQTAQTINPTSTNQGWFCFPTQSGFATTCEIKEVIILENALDTAFPDEWDALHDYVSDTYGTF